MKKNIGVIVGLLALSGTVFAQQQNPFSKPVDVNNPPPPPNNVSKQIVDRAEGSAGPLDMNKMRQQTAQNQQAIGQATPITQAGVPNVVPAYSAEYTTAPARKPKKKIAKPTEPVEKPNAPALAAARLSKAWADNAKAMPTMGEDGRVIFTYGRAVPTVVCAPLRVCDIELEPGESVNGAPHAGDPVRWEVSPAIVGSGDKKTTHVIIKVKSDEPGLSTNLMIPTDRRAYHLKLVSAAQEYDTFVSYYYPENAKRAWEQQKAAEEKKAAPIVAEMPALTADKLRFNYAVDADKGSPAFIPVRVFDDGEKTYFQMPLNMRVEEAPAVVLLDNDGTEKLVNYRLKNGYYIIDRLFTKAALIAGIGDKQDRVIVTRNTCVKSWFSSCAAE